ncbi:MAG: arylesterase [Pseudomonadota bacterium]
MPVACPPRMMLASSGRYGPTERGRKTAAAFLALLTGVCLFALAPRAEEPLRLVAIGDSLTAGYGLEQGTGFVPQLDAWLDGEGLAEVVVVNMGVSGDTTAGGKARLDWALADGADAVMIALGGNDLLRGIPPETSKANLADMLERLSARDLPVLLVGMEAPLNYGPDYKEAFDGMYPALAERYDTLLHPSFFEGLASGETGANQDLFQNDGIHPNAEGVGLMVEAIGARVIELVDRARAGAPG